MYQNICDECKDPIARNDELLEIEHRKKDHFGWERMHFCAECAKPMLIVMESLPTFASSLKEE